MGGSQTCEFQYDYTHQDVKSGKVPAGTFCEEITYKGKLYCKDHCLELGLLSDAETQKEKKRIIRERVQPAAPEADPFMDRILSLFGVVNFNAVSAYKAMQAMRVVAPGEEALEMYIYASWLSSDPDTRFPQLEEDLAEILNVKRNVFEKWKEIPEVFEARNKILTKMALMIGTPRYLVELIRGLSSQDSSLRARAFDVFGKKFLKVDDQEEKKAVDPFAVPQELVPLLQNVLKNLGGHVDRKEAANVKAVRLASALGDLGGVNESL